MSEHKTMTATTGGVHQATAEDKKLYQERLKLRADRKEKKKKKKEPEATTQTNITK